MYEKWHVYEVMTQGAYCATPDMSLKELTAELVARRIHGAPVTNKEGILVGVVSLTDVAACLLQEYDSKRTVKSLMSKRVFKIDHAANLVSAAKKFKESKVHRLIVTHNERVVGVLSATDLIDPFLERLGGYSQSY